MAIGPNVTDIRRRLGMPRTLRASAGSNHAAASEKDPIETAREIRREMLGDRILDSTVDEMETQQEVRKAELDATRAEAEAKRLEATARLEEVRAKGRSSENGQSPAESMALEVIGMLREDKAALTDELKAQREGQLTEAIKELRAEMADLKSQVTGVSLGGTRPDTTSSILDRIEELSAIKGAFEPFFPSHPELAGVSNDIKDIILIKRMEQDNARFLEELKDKREDRSFDRSLQIRKLEVDERRTNELGRMFDGLAPMIAMFARQKLGLPAESPPGTPAAGPIQVQSQLCTTEGCKGVVTFATGQNIAPCPDCGLVYQLSE